MAEKIKKGALKAYFRMLKLWSALMLGIVGVFASRDVWGGLEDYKSLHPGEHISLKYGVVRPPSYLQYIKGEWRGISTNKVYQNDVYQLIKDKTCFEKEWERLEINSPLPEVDFTKNTLVEIVKTNSSKEIIFKETLLKEFEGATKNKVIVFNYYIDSAVVSGNLAYLFLVTPNSDMPILIQEQKYYDGTFITRDYVYKPVNCAYNP